jgi:hypothetical protein
MITPLCCLNRFLPLVAEASVPRRAGRRGFKRGSWARVLAIFFVLGLGAATVSAAQPEWEVFAMDNGVGRGSWAPARQAATLRALGFSGISYNYTTPADLKVWLAETSAAGRRIYGLYFPATLQSERTFPPGLVEAVQALRGSGAVLWLTVQGPNRPGELDAEAIRKVQEAADLAAGAGLRVVLYPHKGFYLATAEQALAWTLKIGRANVGLTVNLAHELAAGNGARLPEIIRQVAPCLQMVTLNGATDQSVAGWGNYIKLLGDGDYDVAAILRTLAEVNYRGPVGIQFYDIKGDPEENLRTTMRAWARLTGAVSGATAR